MAYSYAKHAQYGHVMQRQKLGSLKKRHFHSYKHGQTASIGRAKMACKNRDQERGNEASDIRKIQTAKFPSTTLKKDQKNTHLQFMAASKSVYKHDRNAMQNEAKKWL